MAGAGAYKFETPGTFFIYGALFLFFFVVSPFYAWGIHDLMDKFAPESKTRNSFSFGDELVLLAGIFLALAAYNDIAKQMRKMARLTRVVYECETLLHQFSIVAFQSTILNNNPNAKVEILDSKREKHSRDTAGCVIDCTTMMIICPVFLCIEAKNKNPDQSRIDDTLEHFKWKNVITSARAKSDLLATTLYEIFKTNQVPISSSSMSIFSHRVISMQQSNMIGQGFGTLCAEAATKSVQGAISEFEISRIDTGWWVISIVYTIIGVLYLLLSPFLLWFGQGWFMLYTYPVIFLLVGGLTSYRWFIGDTMLSPRENFIRPVYNRILAMAEKADTITEPMQTSLAKNMFVSALGQLNITAIKS